MADATKETLRAEQHGSVWRIANDLGGSADGGWDFERYVLGILLWRFASKKLTTCLSDLEVAAGGSVRISHPSVSAAGGRGAE